MRISFIARGFSSSTKGLSQSIFPHRYLTNLLLGNAQQILYFGGVWAHPDTGTPRYLFPPLHASYGLRPFYVIFWPFFLPSFGDGVGFVEIDILKVHNFPKKSLDYFHEDFVIEQASGCFHAWLSLRKIQDS